MIIILRIQNKVFSGRFILQVGATPFGVIFVFSSNLAVLCALVLH